MNRTIDVPVFLRDTLRRWRNTPSQGEIPILRKVKLRGDYGVAVVCGDDRMCCETESHLITCCGNGSLWPITIAGGALDLTAINPSLSAYKTVVLREVEKFLAAKHVPQDAPVDILAFGHVDCGFARVNNLSPRAQFEAVREAQAVLGELFKSPRFAVRAGFHMFWEGKHRTYELDVPAALADLEKESKLQSEISEAHPHAFHTDWS